MPLYEVFHSCPLSNEQQEQIAKGITDLHCNTFSAPSIFVNVILHSWGDSRGDGSGTKSIFVGGRKHQKFNYIIGHLRPRPNNHEKLYDITQSLVSLWDVTVRPTQRSSNITDPKALHSVFLLEDIAAGAEQGFILPIAGRDAEWAQQHLSTFEKRAAEGDEGMKQLVEEVKAGKLGASRK